MVSTIKSKDIEFFTKHEDAYLKGQLELLLDNYCMSGKGLFEVTNEYENCTVITPQDENSCIERIDYKHGEAKESPFILEFANPTRVHLRLIRNEWPEHSKYNINCVQNQIIGNESCKKGMIHSAFTNINKTRSTVDIKDHKELMGFGLLEANKQFIVLGDPKVPLDYVVRFATDYVY
jgi:hypothetical protein